MAKRKYASKKRKSKAPPKRRRLQYYKGSGITNAALLGAAGTGLYNTVRNINRANRLRRNSKALVPYTGKKASYSTQVNQDYRSQSARYGLRRTKRRMMNKLLKNELTYNIFSIRNYGIWNRGFGAVPIVANQASGAGTPIDMPVHLWDLTAVPQGNASTSYQYPATFHELYFTTETATGTHAWRTKTGGGNPGQVTNFTTRASTIDKAWCWYPSDTNNTLKPYEAVNAANAFVPPGAKSYLQSVNVKMILNGPQTKPTKWCIQLVQLKQEVTPGVKTTSDNPMGTALADQFWASVAKPYGFSPLDNQMPTRLRKYMKIMKTWYISMDTPESGEDHLKARMRHMTLKLNLNRTLNYVWGPEVDRIGLTTVDIPENGFYGGNNEISNQVHPNARVYLMIRALCEQTIGTVAVPTGYTEQLFPSYDIIMNAVHRGIAD